MQFPLIISASILFYGYKLFACLQYAIANAVTAHFSGGGEYPEEFGGQFETAIGVDQFQGAGFLVQLDVAW